MNRLLPPCRLALTVSLSLLVLSLPGVQNEADAAGRVYRGSATYTREIRQADALLQTGKYQEAEARFNALLRQNPNNLNARGGLSMAQAELFKLDAAEKNALQVLGRDPNNVFANMALGISYRNRTASQDMTYKAKRDEMLSRSANALELAASIDPGSPEAHNQLGETYRFQERYDAADQEFRKALDLDPNYAEALLNQGILQMERGDLTGAEASARRAVRLNSKNHMAHFRLGQALSRQGDYHEAIQSLNTALSLNRGNASIMAQLAETYDKQGNQAAAVANYRKAIHENPSYMPAYVGLSNLLDNRGDGELAMAELKSALNVNPRYTPAKNQLGRLALAVDKPDQAMQYYREALHDNPQDPDALRGLSQALSVVAQKSANWSQTMGQDSQLVDAERAINDALALNPHDLRLHLASLRLSQVAGKPARSQDELERIVNIAPRNDSERMLQGEALLALGRYAEADAAFGRLMQDAGRDTDKLLLIGDTLKINGDLDRARDAYRLAAQVEPGNVKAERGIQRIEAAQADSQKTLRLANALNNWRQKGSSVDFYEEALSKNPRQPEARLALAKLYEKADQYSKAAQSYRFYLGLMPNLEPKTRQKYEKKITRLEELAIKNNPMADKPLAQTGQSIRISP